MNIYKFENFEHIFGVDRFEKEFAKMANEKMKGSPPYSRFQKWLIGRLTILDRMGRDAIRLEGFEKLESENPALFSIRYPHSKLNPRVIYACVSDDDIILRFLAFRRRRRIRFRDGGLLFRRFFVKPVLQAVFVILLHHGSVCLPPARIPGRRIPSVRRRASS